MVNFPTSRKMHIARICGQNKAGDILPEVWVDFARIDRITIKTQDTVHQRQFTNQYQEVNINFKWPDKEGEERDIETRETVDLKIFGPDEDPDDPEEFVLVKVPKFFKFKDGNIDNTRRFLTKLSPKNSTRVIENRRFFHRDTNIDSRAEEAFEGGSKVFVVPVEEYHITGETDEEQYVEHEVITKFVGKATPHWLESPGGADHDTTFKMKNEYLLASDVSEPAKLQVVGSSGFDPPFRLDPFQNIVNCQFGSLRQQWLVSIGSIPEAFGPLSTEGKRYSAIDAEGGNYGFNTQGASGSGFTVITLGCIAYGKITLPNGSKRGVFMRGGNNGVIMMGTPMGGTIQWANVHSVPILRAISYANDKFFVTYDEDDSDPETIAKFAITEDGQSFVVASSGIQSAGNVAYLEDVGYAAIGGKTISNDEMFSQTLSWTSSRDGYSWSGASNESVESGAGEGFLVSTSIAAGNGVFVAAASTKYVFEDNIGGEPNGDFYVLNRSAVAISTTGASWTTVELPDGAVSGGPGNFFSGDTSSYGMAVAFIKDKRREGEPEGYFVASDYTNTSDPDGQSVATYYTSVNGRSWGVLDKKSGPSMGPIGADAFGHTTAIAKNVENTKLVFV